MKINCLILRKSSLSSYNNNQKKKLKKIKEIKLLKKNQRYKEERRNQSKIKLLYGNRLLNGQNIKMTCFTVSFVNMQMFKIILLEVQVIFKNQL